MSGPIQPIVEAPKAFVPLALPINECVKVANAVKSMQGKGGIKVWVADGNIIVEYNPDYVGGDGISRGGSGLPLGYTFTKFTVCSNGTPTNYYWPIWPTNPA